MTQNTSPQRGRRVFDSNFIHGGTMLGNLSDRFYKWAKGWLIFVLFILDGFFAGFLLPLIQGMMQGGQGGIQPLDLMLFATPEKIFAMIERYGEYGRPFYRNVELTVDIIYPSFICSSSGCSSHGCSSADLRPIARCANTTLPHSAHGFLICLKILSSSFCYRSSPPNLPSLRGFWFY